MTNINLADAKAHFSELIAQAESGEQVTITRRGKPVARLSAVVTPRKLIELAVLKTLTDAMPVQAEPASAFVRKMRDQDRY
ncbi:type II toxin-antitoxin system prevent-host-death family antitoxin [Phenylobacterium sp. 20VBR1]|uniref:Antitoxin n=1 Tax=Phenylobacterium glaciei TaxID=2803784 RepID=A0A941CYH9_9CAUL|nr:type II toxin-antitoxin system prevent-host-death family antitoxin [Phenylobacterium glaciei]